jgi:hypothetical protein
MYLVDTDNCLIKKNLNPLIQGPYINGAPYNNTWNYYTYHAVQSLRG